MAGVVINTRGWFEGLTRQGAAGAPPTLHGLEEIFFPLIQ